MIAPVQAQLAKLWKLLTDADTLGTYQRAVRLTWEILQETARLIWLGLCLLLVAGASGWMLSIWAGQQARVWWENAQKSDQEPVLNQMGRALVEAGRSSLMNALETARQELGVEEGPLKSLVQTIEAKPDPIATAPTASPSDQATALDASKPNSPKDKA